MGKKLRIDTPIFGFNCCPMLIGLERRHTINYVYCKMPRIIKIKYEKLNISFSGGNQSIEDMMKGVPPNVTVKPGLDSTGKSRVVYVHLYCGEGLLYTSVTAKPGLDSTGNLMDCNHLSHSINHRMYCIVYLSDSECVLPN